VRAQRVFSVLYLLLSLLLLIISYKIRAMYQSFFMEIHTETMSGQVLFSNFHYPWAILLPRAWSIIPAFFMAYIVSSFLLCGAALCIYRALLCFPASRFLSSFGLGQFLASHDREVRLGLFIAGFSLSLLLNVSILLNQTLLADEFSYLFQAKILLKGALYETSPPLRDSFQSMHIINNGKWFSRFPVGWPILMAIGGCVGNFHLLADLAAGLFLVVLFMTGSELFNRSIGFLGALSVLISPFFLLNSATFQPHMVGLLFVSCTILFFIRFLKGSKGSDAFLFSLFFGCCLNVRFIDALLLAPLLAVFFLFNPFRKGQILKSLSVYIVYGMPAMLLFAGLLLAINHMQFGNPLTTGYSAEIPGWCTHIALPSITWNALLSALRLIMWSPFLVIEMLIVALWSTEKNRSFLLLSILPYFAFYSLWSLGQVEFGPRFLFPSLAGIGLLTGAGLSCLKALLERRGWQRAELFVAALSFCCLVLTLSVIFPLWPGNIRNTIKSRLAFEARLHNIVLSQSPRALVFVRNLQANGPTIAFIRNYAPLDAPVIYVNFFTHEENRDLMSHFSDATPFILRYDEASKEMMVESYTRERLESGNSLPEDLYFAAQNYENASLLEKAELTYKKLIAAWPGYFPAYYRLVKLYDMSGRRKEAIETLESISKARMGDISLTRLYLARLYASDERNDEALSQLRMIESGSLNNAYKAEAADLEKYLFNKGDSHSFLKP
jgi:tetratricopeptide (TPR) repeat protein